MTASVCRSCAKPLTDAGLICHACSNRLRLNLVDVPALLAELERTRLRQAKVATVAGYQPAICPHPDDSNCDCGVTLPWSERAAACQNDIRVTCSHWAAVLAHGTGELPPRRAPWAYLAQRHLTLRMRPWAAAAEYALQRSLRAGWAAIDRPEARLYAGTCDAPVHVLSDPDDDGRSVLEEYACGWTLWAALDDITIECRGCKAVHNVLERREQMLERARDELFTATQCALALTTISLPITPELISKWAHRTVRGVTKLPIAGYTPQGRPLYRLGDVRDVARGLVVSQRAPADEPAPAAAATP